MILLRLLVALALLGLGAGAALAAALIHQWWWGLALGLGAAALATRALPAGRWRLAFMLGWFGAIVYVVLPRAEGDYVIPATGAGYALLGVSFGLFLVALATLPRPGSSTSSRGRGDADDPVVSPP